MKPSVKQAFDALWYYLSDLGVFIEWDEKEQCFIVDSSPSTDNSKFRHIEDAVEWALKMAKGDTLED